jgi:hypothetical protein
MRLPEKPPDGAPWSFESSPDLFQESEVLVHGPVEGAQVVAR